MRWYLVAATGGLVVLGIATTTLAFSRRDLGAVASQAQPTQLAGCTDSDGDGYGLGCPLGMDCNDLDSTIHPAQAEQCNLRDDNCDALVDELEGCIAPPVEDGHVPVPSGRFLMGSVDGAEDEKPQHEVSLPGFRIDRYEVTNRRYEECVKASACDGPTLPMSHLRKEYFRNPAFADYPVVFVNWSQAKAFCQFAGGRLPTEAEWEMVARGKTPSARTYPWGDETPDCTRANLGGKGSCVGDTDRVGRRPAGASPLGAQDMAGNVWEWVSDWYDRDYYASAPSSSPKGPDQGNLKVMRGGCWLSGTDSLRVSCRKAELPSTWAYNVGFRCAYPEGR